jgi:predicted acylesterase/phospholipase RssA
MARVGQGARRARSAARADSGRTKTAIVLSAGAPHSPLMAGALAALCEHKRTFDVVYTSGAGTLIGLLFVAPKGKSPQEALGAIVDLGVSDAIYRFLPIGYKAFFKPGPFTQPIHRWAQQFKLGNFPLRPLDKPITPIGHAYNAAVNTLMTAKGGAIKRTYNDLVDMWAAVITPLTLTPWSKGVSPPLPFIEDLVDFDKLHSFPFEFFANAFKVAHVPEGPKGRSGLKAMLFAKDVITPQHVRAAFAYPFVYEPVLIKGEHYFEGADRDPINFGNLLTSTYTRRSVKTIVLIDILASLDRHLLRPARSLWDAYGLSIMAPVVANAKKELTRFENEFYSCKEIREKRDPAEYLARYPDGYPEEFLKLTFDISDEEGQHLTEWSYSNLSTMFKIGYECGQKFWKDHAKELTDKLPEAPA